MTTVNPATTLLPAVVLVDLESVGKSALFRALTGQATGDELNFRGSTVGVRRAPLLGQAARVVNVPGIRAADDSDTTRLALAQIAQADTILLVARGTHARQEVEALLASLSVGQMFVLVYLASTLTACLVTLWTARKELGGEVAAKIAGRQALTSLVSTFLLALLLQ